MLPGDPLNVAAELAALEALQSGRVRVLHSASVVGLDEEYGLAARMQMEQQGVVVEDKSGEREVDLR